MHLTNPTPINYFTDSQIKIITAAIGKYHSVALTAAGQIYTWGSADYLSILISKFIKRSINPLGRQ